MTRLISAALAVAELLIGCLPLAIAAGLAAMAVDAFGGDETEVAP
jgi:high-affinity Fe2+/Pb2+ permease